MVKHLLCGASYSEEPRLYSDVWTLHWQSREKHHIIKKILCAVKEVQRLMEMSIKKVYKPREHETPEGNVFTCV